MIESNTFRVRLKDYLAWILHYRFVKPTYSRLAMYGLIVVGLVLAGVFFISGLRHDVQTALTRASVVIGVLSAWILLLNLAFPALGYWQLRMNGNYNSDCRIIIDKNHVHTSDTGSDLRKAWVAIDHVMETKSHILIYFNRCNAFVVPKTAFNSLDDAKAFREAADGFLRNAKAKA
jgi:hypothetical protein